MLIGAGREVERAEEAGTVADIGGKVAAGGAGASGSPIVWALVDSAIAKLVRFDGMFYGIRI